MEGPRRAAQGAEEKKERIEAAEAEVEQKRRELALEIMLLKVGDLWDGPWRGQQRVAGDAASMRFSHDPKSYRKPMSFVSFREGECPGIQKSGNPNVFRV